MSSKLRKKKVLVSIATTCTFVYNHTLQSEIMSNSCQKVEDILFSILFYKPENSFIAVFVCFALGRGGHVLPSFVLFWLRSGHVRFLDHRWISRLWGEMRPQNWEKLDARPRSHLWSELRHWELNHGSSTFQSENWDISGLPFWTGDQSTRPRNNSRVRALVATQYLVQLLRNLQLHPREAEMPRLAVSLAKGRKLRLIRISFDIHLLGPKLYRYLYDLTVHVFFRLT